jgi:hypothetical protein
MNERGIAPRGRARMEAGSSENSHIPIATNAHDPIMTGPLFFLLSSMAGYDATCEDPYPLHSAAFALLIDRGDIAANLNNVTSLLNTLWTKPGCSFVSCSSYPTSPSQVERLYSRTLLVSNRVLSIIVLR